MEIVAGLPLKYLRLESDIAPMNLVNICEYKPNTNYAAPSLDALRNCIAERLTSIRVLRQRIYESPFRMASPLWLDDPHIDIIYHVNEAFYTNDPNEVIATLAPTKLDRGSPLWRVTIARSLENNSFTLILVTHKALACRLQVSLFDLLFTEKTIISEDSELYKTTINMEKSSVLGFQWRPDALPSRNELLNLAKSDWLSIPKQTKELSKLLLGQWAKKRISENLVPKESLPPQWISAPKTIFNQPNGTKRSLAHIIITPKDARVLRRSFKSFVMRDLIFVLITRSLKDFLDSKLHHMKEELIALVQCSALDDKQLNYDASSSVDDYQLLRLPTQTTDAITQFETMLERREMARDYYSTFTAQSNLGLIPSSVLTFLVKTYDKINAHKLHNPICNLVISESQKNQNMQHLNNFNLKHDLSFASLLPNIGLHLCYWIDGDEACISFTAAAPALEANELKSYFLNSLDELKQSFTGSLRKAL